MIKRIQQMTRKMAAVCILLMVCLSGCDQLNQAEDMEPPPLPAPTGFSATSNTHGKVSLTWNVVDRATSYEVFSSTSNDSSNATGLVSTSLTTIDVDLTPDEKYYFWVRAKNSTETTSYSFMASATVGNLLAPTGLSATSSTPGKVSLTWDVVDGATSYEVFYSTDNDSSNVNSLVSTGLSNVDEYLTPAGGVRYYFWIKAKKGTLTSDFSSIMVSTTITDYEIGNKGPGGGLVFYIVGSKYYECSDNLGKTTWHRATDLAEAHRGGDYADWYLPSKIQLNFIYENLRVPGHISDNEWFWSSSESSNYGSDAWSQYFYDGTQDTSSKTYSNSVRAIRAF